MCLLDLKLTHPIMNDFILFFDRGAVRNLGKPVALCKRYYQDGADEVSRLSLHVYKNSINCVVDMTNMLLIRLCFSTSQAFGKESLKISPCSKYSSNHPSVCSSRSL